MQTRRKFYDSETQAETKSVTRKEFSPKKNVILPKRSKAFSVLKLSPNQVVFAKAFDKLWACKVIALFVKHNDLGLSSQKQLELSLLHPEVVIEKLLKLAKLKQMHKAATTIQTATRHFFEARRKKKAEAVNSSAASLI